MAYGQACRLDLLRPGYRCRRRAGASTDSMTLSLSAARYRNYHPALGRWIERDPEGYVDGMSLYQYCRLNPVGGTDPTGLYDDGSYSADEAWYYGLDDTSYSDSGNDASYYGFGDTSAQASAVDEEAARYQEHLAESGEATTSNQVVTAYYGGATGYYGGASAPPVTLGFSPPEITSHPNAQGLSFMDLTLGNAVDILDRTVTFGLYGSGAIVMGVFEDVFAGLAAVGSLPPGSVPENIIIGPAAGSIPIWEGFAVPIEIPQMQIPTGNIRRACSLLKSTFEETSAKTEQARKQAEATVESALSKPYRGINDTKEPDDLWSKTKRVASKLIDEVTRPVVDLEMKLRQYRGDDLF